jgi:hypothetical protein
MMFSTTTSKPGAGKPAASTLFKTTINHAPVKNSF